MANLVSRESDRYLSSPGAHGDLANVGYPVPSRNTALPSCTAGMTDRSVRPLDHARGAPRRSASAEEIRENDSCTKSGLVAGSGDALLTVLGHGGVVRRGSLIREGPSGGVEASDAIHFATMGLPPCTLTPD